MPDLHSLLSGEPGRQHASEQLRRAILAGDMAPGQRLVEEELAALLQVTRASVRAALIDLTAAGLVERIPNRGARVRAVTLDEAIAITECRMALEGLCARKAAERVTPEQATALRELGTQMADAVTRLIDNTALRLRLARTGNDFVQRYNWPNAADRLEALLLRP